MRWDSFQTRVSGKWVLTGEHSVLRGATAVALPYEQVGLNLIFEPGDGEFCVDPKEARSLIEDLILSVAENWESEGRSFQRPEGKLKIESTIPIGAGLGSSAALCVALSRWMSDPMALSGQGLIEFATQLEHRFHGRSSGMDVAVISSSEPITFVMERGSRSLGVKRLPKFTLHDTGLRSRTSECILRVEAFREQHPTLALQVDEAMGTASRHAMEGLLSYDAGNTQQGLSLLQTAMNRARECFYTWELVPGEAKRLEERLLRDGALAVKLTGAGGGGMIVALWDEAGNS